MQGCSSTLWSGLLRMAGKRDVLFAECCWNYVDTSGPRNIKENVTNSVSNAACI